MLKHNKPNQTGKLQLLVTTSPEKFMEEKNTTLTATGYYARKKSFDGNEANFLSLWIVCTCCLSLSAVRTVKSVTFKL